MGRKKNKIRFRKNDQIQADKIRLIDKKGDQIGVMSLKEAKKLAKEKKLDLIEVAPQAKPPVVKLLKYNKFIYEEDKKRAKSKKETRGGELKEIQLSPFIGEADLNYRLKKAHQFAKENNSLRIALRFKGRQITQKKFGYELLERVEDQLSDLYKKSGKIKEQGNRLIMRLDPIKNG